MKSNIDTAFAVSQIELEILAIHWVGLVWFYCISTIVGYLMSNLFLYI